MNESIKSIQPSYYHHRLILLYLHMVTHNVNLYFHFFISARFPFESILLVYKWWDHVYNENNQSIRNCIVDFL